MAWAPITLPPERFAQQLGSATCGESDPIEALDRVHANDLYLACAAGLGIAGAADEVVALGAPAITGYVSAIDSSPSFVDEVRAAVIEKLLAPAEGAPRILQYQGRAPLAAWIGIAAQRMALSLLRADGAHARAADRAGREPLLELDPELRYLKQRYRDSFESAIAGALAALSPRDRALVRLHTVGGLPLAKIGPMYGVDESTASRWLQRARLAILEGTQRALERTLGVSEDEFKSIARLVASQLDVSVARLLAHDVTNVR